MVSTVKIIFKLCHQNNRQKTIIINNKEIICPVDMHILRDATNQSECHKLTNQVKEINCIYKNNKN